MLLLHFAQQISPYVADPHLWGELSPQWFSHHSAIDWNLLAQFNTDVFAGTRAYFNNFVKSGQVWALLIGIVLGYLFRGFTTYG